jgi:hypothetical protein
VSKFVLQLKTRKWKPLGSVGRVGICQQVLDLISEDMGLHHIPVKIQQMNKNQFALNKISDFFFQFIIKFR